jgi:hypothetical protein
MFKLGNFDEAYILYQKAAIKFGTSTVSYNLFACER